MRISGTILLSQYKPFNYRISNAQNLTFLRCWDTSIEYVLCDHDPRRFKPIVDFCINTALNANFQGASAFDRKHHISFEVNNTDLCVPVTRSVQLARSVIRCLQWRFNAWADDFVDVYFREVTCPYAEVRGLIASVLNAIDQLKVSALYSSF